MQPAPRHGTSLWKYLFFTQAALLLGVAYLYYGKIVQVRNLSRPVLVETNIVVTNMTTNIDVITNVIVKNEVTNIPRVAAPVPAPAPSKETNTQPTWTGPKAVVRGYNIVPWNGIKYARAVVQNLTPMTLKRVRVTFTEYGLNQRGQAFTIGNVSDNIINLPPFQYGEVRTSVDPRTLHIEVTRLDANE
jgi:hypothetical protein